MQNSGPTSDITVITELLLLFKPPDYRATSFNSFGNVNLSLLNLFIFHNMSKPDIVRMVSNAYMSKGEGEEDFSIIPQMMKNITTCVPVAYVNIFGNFLIIFQTYFCG